MNGFSRLIKLPSSVAAPNAADPFFEDGWIKIGMFVTSEAVSEANHCTLGCTLDQWVVIQAEHLDGRSTLLTQAFNELHVHIQRWRQRQKEFCNRCRHQVPVRPLNCEPVVEQVQRFLNPLCAAVELGLNFVALSLVVDIVFNPIPQLKRQRITLTVEI